ncbi:MAG: hypothetical protein R3C68_03005 [Myxococcota bacterium]
MVTFGKSMDFWAKNIPPRIRLDYAHDNLMGWYVLKKNAAFRRLLVGLVDGNGKSRGI